MKQQFLNLCLKIGCSENCNAAFEKMLLQYMIPKRFYHTFEGHVAFCLHELEKIPAEYTCDRDAIAMALFMHDAVMNFTAKNNEERSAEFSEKLCQEIKAPQEFIAKVTKLILATQHKTPQEDTDEQIIADIDLAILGQEKEIYDACERNIYLEYSFVPEDIFKRERFKFLHNLLGRKRIYQTSYFKNNYEARARKNILRSIEALGQ